MVIKKITKTIKQSTSEALSRSIERVKKDVNSRKKEFLSDVNGEMCFLNCKHYFVLA